MQGITELALRLTVWLTQLQRDAGDAAQRRLTLERGQGMVEYGLILALVAIGVIAVLIVLGGQVGGIFTDAGNALRGARATPVSGG